MLRSLTHGSTGNISIRHGSTILVTPTGSSLGTVEPDELSVIDRHGVHIAGAKPSKESFLHAAAVSCLADVDASDALPPLTAYFAMRIGRLPLLPYHAPGDESLEALAEATAVDHLAFLLSNHGPVVSGATLSAAMDALEELEETAKLFLLLRGQKTRPLSAEEVRRLAPR